MSSLLEKAKSLSKNGKNYSEEEINFALAWISGEITTQQAAKTIGNNPRFKLMSWVKHAFEKGLLKKA